MITDTELKYKIRFQNTGTDTAFTVVVVDTLSANLDVSSLREIITSHPFTYNVSGQGVLTFTFDNILLPDSNVNEPASHGFIEFTIDQHPSNGIGTVIENTAEIYFDFNPAIVTNTVTNTIVTITDISEKESITNSLNVYPNPSKGNVFIDVNLKENTNLSIDVVDILGASIYSMDQKDWPAGKHGLVWDTADYKAGIYFITVVIGSEKFIEKVVVQ